MHRAAAAAAAVIDRAIRSTLSPVIESLEDRRLLAAPELVDGVITWVGGPEDNRFLAFIKGKSVVVRADGVTTLFPVANVSALSADGGDGNDRLEIIQETAKFLLRATFAGGIGDDVIIGGGGRNTIRGGPGLDSLTGGAGKDNISGNEDADTIDAGLGNDKLVGNDGDDSILAGAGNDTIFGGLGNDYLRGDDGDDLIAADDGDDYANGGNGNDTVTGATGADRLYGGIGDDSVSGDDGDDRLQGDKGNDSLLGGAGLDTIFGRTSKDTGSGSGEEDPWSGTQLDNDDIYGGADADVIYAGPGDDLVFGEAGDDQLFAGGGWDDVSGGDGNDTIDGGAGEDVVSGDAGFDLLSGGDDADAIAGGADGDILAGGNGDDTLEGGAGNDSLLGEAGDDDLDGQLGLDSLAGGAGADVFAASTDGDLTDKNEFDPGGSGSNIAPNVASVSASADPVIVGDLLTLTANGVTDLDGFILAVRFYRETNGVFGLQTGVGGDLLIGTDGNGADAGGWSTVIDMNGVEPGQYEFHAQATDNGLALSAAVSTIVSVEMPHNLRPTITALVASVTPVEIGTSFVLTAQGVKDLDGSVKSVSFFEETNGIAGLQTGPGGDKLLGNGTRNFTNWLINVANTNRQARDYVFYARATDNGYGFSAVSSTVVTVVPPANKTPKVGGLTASPATLVAGATLTLTANSVTDPDGTVTQVRFYYEFNGIDGLQLGDGGDAFLAADTTAGATWTASIPTTGWNAGEYRFYAQATDDDGATGNAVIALATVESFYLVDVVVDNAVATLTGTWTSAAGAPGQYGADYLHDGNQFQGAKSATFAHRLPQASVYEVFACWPAAMSHASNALVDVIDSAGVTHTVTVNQRQRGGEWVSLGSYHFSTASDAIVRFRNDAADGFVIADAVRFATGNRPPVIGEMGDFPSTVKAGESLMVFAKNITDRDGRVASVSFYRESNGIAGLQSGAGGDTFLGTDTTITNGAYSVSFVVLGLMPATYTYYAQATDEEGAVGNPLSTTNIVAP